MDRRIVQSIDESDEEEEELEALRLAALRSRRQTESYTQKRQSQRNNKKDIRHVSLGCDERSVVETGSPKTYEYVSSSSSTDYEEIDLSGTSPEKQNEYFQTYSDSDENENVFVKEDSISGTPSDFENVEENGNPSGEEEEAYFDSDITQDQSLDVETEAGIVDNLTITFSNEAGKNVLGHRTSSVTQSDEEEEEEEGGDEEKEEEEEERLGVAIEGDPEEDSASTSSSDFTEEQLETRESQFHMSHTRIIIADSDSEEEEEEVDLMDSKGTDTKESALFNKSKHEVSVNGLLGPPQLTSVQAANKCSSGDSAAKTIVQKENVAASREHLIMEDQHSKSTFVTKMAASKKKKENERASDDKFSKEYPLSTSKHVAKAHAIKDSAPKKVKQTENERASCEHVSKENPLSNYSAQKNHKQKEKHIALIHDNILKEDALSKAKPVSDTSPRVRDQLENEGRRNSSRTRSSENAEQKITTKIASVVTSRECATLKTTRAQDNARTAPQPKKVLDVEDNDADRLSIGTSDEDNEFEQSEEQQPAIKSKIGVNKMSASSNSHTASRDRSRHRRSRSHDKSNSPRKSWSHDRDRGAYRSYDRSWTRDNSGMHDRSESRGGTRYNHSPIRSGRAHVHERSREETTFASNQWRHSERSQLVDRRKDRRNDRRRSTRSRSRERHDSQRSSVANRDKRNDRKRSRSFDSPPPPPIKSKPTVNTFGNKPSNHKRCSERTYLSSRFEKNREKDKIQPNEKHKHSKPRKEIKAVMANGQKESVCTALATKQDVKQERKRSKDESDLRVKLKDPPCSTKTVEKKSSKIAVHSETTTKGLPDKTDKKKVEVTVAQKTDNNEGEEELNTRIAKIRQKNKNILKRAREVEADKEKATHSRSRIL